MFEHRHPMHWECRPIAGGRNAKGDAMKKEAWPSRHSITEPRHGQDRALIPFDECSEGQSQAPPGRDGSQHCTASSCVQQETNRGCLVPVAAAVRFGLTAVIEEALPVRSGPIQAPKPITSPRSDNVRTSASNLPMTVKDAASFLGVSCQTVYLWVERKQIPHLRVMGRNIRFLRSDLEPFRAQFRQEVANAETA